MPLLNYSTYIVLPFILIFSLPLAIFATITSIFALTILLLHALLLYTEVAAGIAPHFIQNLISSSPTTKPPLQPQPPSTTPSPPRRRRRRASTSSSVSLTPSSSFVGLSQSIGAQRDFEGVGGWRVSSEADEEDDAIWTSMNSRLEFPTEQGRRHRRTLTSASMPGERRVVTGSYSPEVLTRQTSPNTSRARTPPTSMVVVGGMEQGYFPLRSGRGESPPKGGGR